ncbi:MAG: hypothetical protein IJ086_04590, partial [Clostridium sp.]|nr:hypothetical protein [Clostridium sp.]
GKTLDIESLYYIFTSMYREEFITINKDLPLEEQIHWHNFDKLLKKAPKDWFRVNKDSNEYNRWLNTTQKRLLKKGTLTEEDRKSLNYLYIRLLEQPIIHVNVLEVVNKIVLSKEAEDFFTAYQMLGPDKQNVEQSTMVEIIKILRKSDDPLAYEIYKLIRSSVAAKDMHVNLFTKRVKSHFLEEYEFLMLRKKINKLAEKTGHQDIERVVFLFEELYDFITLPQDIKYCKVCGNPVWEDECVGDIICKSKLKTGQEQYAYYTVAPGKTVYYLKDGVIRFNSIPGIDELWLYLKLLDKYEQYDFMKINIYPGKDAEGDIVIIIGEYRILVDLKGWRKSWMLEEKIDTDASSFENTDYLFIPENLSLFYSNGLDGLNRTLKRNNLKTVAVSDRQFFRRIDEEINCYLNDVELQAKLKECKQEQASFLEGAL